MMSRLASSRLAILLLLAFSNACAFVPSVRPHASVFTQQYLPTTVRKRNEGITRLCGNTSDRNDLNRSSRRDILAVLLGGGIGNTILSSDFAWAAGDLPDSLDVDNFLRSGMVAQPMGVSGQAGKSRPETGVVLREGSEASRDNRSGSVLAEILVGSRDNPTAVLASFVSPWPLATGTVFDVECRNAKTGDGAFLTVSESAGGKSVGNLPDSFFLDQLFRSTGRFSFYGAPTDVKVKRSQVKDNYRFIELSFSNLSQSTQTEIPRNALVAATIPDGTDNAVMLVGSATASRWRKGSDDAVKQTVESFRAIPAPKSSLKIRPKERGSTNVSS